MIQSIRTQLELLASPSRRDQTKKFFKTAPGEYSHQDIFIGIDVPTLRRLAKGWIDLEFEVLEALLTSLIHEERHLALFIAIYRYQKRKGSDEKEALISFLFKNLDHINNWDLVDTIAPVVFGHYAFHHKVDWFEKWSISPNLWHRRLAIVSTLYFVRQGRLDVPLGLIEKLLLDKENLMHKATGWVLREVGKKNRQLLIDFLKASSSKMASVTLSYALEKFTKQERLEFRNQRDLQMLQVASVI